MGSPKIDQIQKIKDQFKEFFKLTERTLRISNAFLDKLENHFAGNIPFGAKRICLCLSIQQNRLLDSIISLCKKGLDQEASILLRSLLENSSYMMFISEKDHEKRAELYQHSRAISTARHIRQLNSNVPDGEEIIDETSFFEDERKAFEFFRKEYGDELSDDDIKRKHALRPQNASEQLTEDIETKKVFHSTYRMYYPDLASLSHAEAPGRYLYEENGKLCFKRWSRDENTRVCLQHGTLYSLLSLESLSKFLAIDINANLNSIKDELFLLIQDNLGLRAKA